MSKTSNVKKPAAVAGAAPCSALTSRQIEIKQLEIAIEKTKAAQVRADQTLDALHDKLMGQIAELRFQKLMARMDTPNEKLTHGATP